MSDRYEHSVDAWAWSELERQRPDLTADKSRHAVIEFEEGQIYSEHTAGSACIQLMVPVVESRTTWSSRDGYWEELVYFDLGEVLRGVLGEDK